ncbi:chorion class CB protein PC404-like [Choristoneura fumiferana]|uniref:chorion class CB protein PC404-like n=1 Tax=Choristoneura fumiferana TaxID=7141 RepID=UPI003D156C53
MAFKTILLFASALFVQSILAQQCQPTPSCRVSGSGVVSGTSSSGGGALQVTSAGPVVPRGLAAATDQLQLAGTLALDGSVPFLSAVAFDGQFPNSGAASVSYGCGDAVAITQETGNPSGSNAASSKGLSADQLTACGRRN